MHQFISALKGNDTVHGTYLVKHKSLSVGKTGKPYIAMVLGDRTGSIDARIWDNAEEIFERIHNDEYLDVDGHIVIFQSRKQLVLRHVEGRPASEVDAAMFLPLSQGNVEEMYAAMVGILESIQNPDIRWLALELIRHPEIAPRYKMAPAARTVHHAMLGGLLEHSLSVVRLADFLGTYYPMVDRSYLLFGAAFHDFGKVFELEFSTGFNYTLEGKLVGHLVTGAMWIDRLCEQRGNFPEEVKRVCQHLILAHHGELEYGSPKLPSTLEAVVLWLIDNLDSKVQAISAFMETEGVTGGHWTSQHRFFNSSYYCPEKSETAAWLESRGDEGKSGTSQAHGNSPKPAPRHEGGGGKSSSNKATATAASLGKLVPDDLRTQLEQIVKKP